MCKKSWKIPNAVMLTEEEQGKLRSLFEVIEDSPEFQSVAIGPWRVNGAEVMTAADMRTYYASGGTMHDHWYPILDQSLRDQDEVAVFEISNQDRRKLEHLPPHVAGRVATFVLDARQKRLIFVMTGIYSM